jgi:hypothetical protein
LGSHSNLGASSMSRWSNCTMSPSLIETLDPELRNKSSKAAEEGSAAHRLCDLGVSWISEQIRAGSPKSVLRDALLVDLVGIRIAKVKYGDDWEVVGNDPFSGYALAGEHEVLLDWEFNVFTCDAEMQHGVRRYLEEVLAVIEECEHAHPTVRPETRCRPLNDREDVYGTSDCVIYDPTSRKLWVIDFKYGRGLVSAIDNVQALFYAAGGVAEYSENPSDQVKLMIVQPRVKFADGRDVSDQVMSAENVMDWVSSTLSPAIDACESPAKAEYKIGTWCRFCPAAAICPLMQKEAVKAAQEAFADELETLAFEDIKDVELVMPEAGDPQQLASALKIAKVLEIWTIRVREMADVVGKKAEIPGFKLVQKQTKRRWRDDAEVIDALGGNFDGYAPSKPKTPAQMEKCGALSKDEIEELSVKPEGRLTLVPDSDRRNAVEPAAQAFPSIED